MPLPLNSALDRLQLSGIRKFAALAKEVPGCISLTMGEPGENTPDAIKDQVALDLATNMTHYPPNNGHAFLKEAISEFMARQGLAYSPDEIIVTAGATEALYAAATTVLSPGDEVVIPGPGFILYESMTIVNHGTPVVFDTTPTNYQITPEALEAAVTDRTKAIVLTSPNNPTGVILNKDSLAAVAKVARERGIYVICDDVYNQLVYADGYKSFAESYPDLREQTIRVDSFSKPYAMTGWRMGWIAADASFIAQASKIHQYMVSCIPSFLQHAGVEALATDIAPMREMYRQRRDLVVSRLREMGLDLVEPEGAFYAFPSIEQFGMTSEEFCRRLIFEGGVALTPGVFFNGEGHVRLSFASSYDVLEEGLARMAAFVDSLR